MDLETLLALLPARWVLPALLAAVALPHLLAWLPQGQPGTAWGTLRSLLDRLAGNYGNAANRALTARLSAATVAQGLLSGWRAAAIAPPLSAADRDILVRTVWGEARGEPEAGQVAVVHVVRNRALARRSSAAVECQRRWQFSAWNADDPNRAKMLSLKPADPDYQRIAAVVDRAWAAPDTVADARHYYALSIDRTPAWARPPAREVARIGGHVFFAGVA
ncbi:cell wall hydrolase [Paracraurococcus lichenis]|uniref:Cell wall hydrolase n=1 Tax=Paracraurococcus lichenis TaxID=3064888 RepID=A0ABT9E8L4_9PROT|nr:cell wall hydrolase [Paracraurococcus sp. LOR1-02]MDO9712467.1 cell wall hydrolase [Paracraurococcus sp. LOR1-02]